MNTLLLDALNCRNGSRPPVWLMRQAGRHMAAYRTLRNKYSFLEMCHHPELVTEVTLLPVHRYGVDAAVLFSDILVVAEALGVGLRFEEQLGPIIERPIQSEWEIDHLPPPTDLSGLEFVAQGIRHTKPCLHVPLIGFCGAPFTLASYLIEGKTSRDLKKTKQWMFNNPQAFHRLLKTLADWSVAYLHLQIQAGVDALQIFDSWANVLPYRQFCEFSAYYLNYILERLKSTTIPVILFCRGSSVFAPQLATLQPAAISLDWNCDLPQMRQNIPRTIALQGNLDPDLLAAPKLIIEKEANVLLDAMEGEKGFIFNLGHGIAPTVSEEAVQTLIDCVKRRI